MRRDDHLPTPEEAERIRTGVGDLLRRERLSRALVYEHLAMRSATSIETARQIEHGLRRPGRSILGALARGLDPDRQEEIFARLVELAERDGVLRETSTGWKRWHRRRVAEAMRRDEYALGSADVRAIEAHARARQLQAQAARLSGGSWPDRLARSRPSCAA